MILFPASYFPVTAGKCLESVYAKTGGTQDIHVRGLGFIASLDANAIWRLMFRLPPALPSGTVKFACDLYADATSGVCRLNPKWKAFNADADLTTAALSAEGVTPTAKTGGGASDTMQWEAGDNIRALVAKWNLDATTAPAAGQIVMVDLTGENTSWTLAQILTTVPYILVE